jgi:urease accessory protein
MPAERELLTALQHGDSLFPSGGSSFSWGLEPAHRDGLVRDAAQVAAFVSAQLNGRWRPFDRPILCAAHRADADPSAWTALDTVVERMTMAAELRDGSRRAGAALLAIHSRLGTPGADAYYRAVRDGTALGHVAVVQGAVWCAAGIGEAAACAISVHALVSSMLGAALRLNLIGHAAAQAIRTDLQAEMAAAIEEPPAPIDEIASFAPLADIAAMRHADQPMRLFAT